MPRPLRGAATLPAMTPVPAPPGPPQKPRRTLGIVLISVAAVVALCCICGVAGGVWIFRLSEPPREATRAYLDEVVAEDYHGAYARLCQRVRAGTTENEFARMHADSPQKPVSYRITGFHVNTGAGGQVADIAVRMDMDDGTRIRHTFHLIWEDDEWRICE